ncbi:MAG TPA: PQQ-binding-like beta-propeller repeat protein [Anaerolineales bacterium]|nr:PQQ-binding-like beta-propeller repeat protein [Anaerolineales bacterium]
MKLNRLISQLMQLVFVLSLLALNFSPVSASTLQITSLSANTLARSGRLRIFGSGFGTDGQVLIDGQPSPIADWADTLIVAYIPETARLGAVTVQAITPAGNSNMVSLTVTTRQSNGRVKWRFQHSGMYTVVRPAVGPDGTVYVVDVGNHLYALSPDGALKWIVRGAGEKGLAVGTDGAIYTGSESNIMAFNPNGTLKWSFEQNPRAMILLGPNVGPDGNIYAVSTEGIGIFSLTPSGVLRWTQPETYDRRIVDYQEVVFGPNAANQQMYFLANNHLKGLRLDGNLVFTIPSTGNQPAIGPDGTVYTTYTALGAYTPTGSTKWSFTGAVNNAATAPDVGPDGVVYFVHNLSTLYAVNPNGSQRWSVVTSEIMEDPIVSPLNSMVAMGGIPTYGMSGFFKAVSTTTHNELWRVTLAPENGGNLVPDSRPCFTSDGQTLYITAQILGGDQSNLYGYIYAIDAAGGTPPTPGPTNTPVVNTPGSPKPTNTPIVNTPVPVTPTHTSIVNTPVPLTPTSTPGAGTITGFLSSSANTAQTSNAGDNNGYQTNPANAYANDSSVTTDIDSGTNKSVSCTDIGKDKHHYYNYNLNLPATAVIQGIQVRLDARADTTSGSPKICVQLSWDGGITWTTARSTTTLSTSEATYILGSPSDTWGRTWNSSHFNNANFRLRVIDVSGNPSLDFFLDYVAVNVAYQP